MTHYHTFNNEEGINQIDRLIKNSDHIDYTKMANKKEIKKAIKVLEEFRKRLKTRDIDLEQDSWE